MARAPKGRGRGKKLIEERISIILERVILVFGALAKTAVLQIGALIRVVARWYAASSRRSQLFVVALAALVVAGYVRYHYQYNLEVRDPVVHIDDSTEALGRVIRSEVGNSSKIHRIHVAWATRNLAEERNQTVAEMACSPCGRQERGRPVSSRLRARPSDRILAQAILTQPQEVDPTGGATHFINPRVQDELARSGRVPGYKGRTYKSVRKRWIEKYGWEPYYRLGPDLEMWGNKRTRRKSSR